MNGQLMHVEAGYSSAEAAKKLDLAIRAEEKGMSATIVEKKLREAAECEAEGR